MHGSTSMRKTLDFEKYTAKWSQRLWEKSKVAEFFAGKTWHTAGDGCFMTARSTGKLLLAGSKVRGQEKQDLLLCFFFCYHPTFFQPVYIVVFKMCHFCSYRYRCCASIWCFAVVTREGSAIRICSCGMRSNLSYRTKSVSKLTTL